MKKLVFIAVILILGIISARGQLCPDSLYITTQAQIDSFQILYPNCTEIEGDVDIGEWIAGTDISNLDGLIGLTSIGGSLKIHLNYFLTDFSGLDNVTSIGGNLGIMSNGNLTSLMGLESLTSIGGGLEIWYCDGLTNLIELNNLASIGGYLGIWSCDGLTSLTGLDNITSLGGSLVFVTNHALTNLSGLENVTSISGRIWIIQNHALTSLSGLENVDENSIDSLLIRDNSSLITCEVQSVCNYISAPGGTVDIHDNAPGCNSQAEVEEACDAVSVAEQFLNTILTIYPNPANQELNISAEDYTIDEVIIYTLTGQQVLQARPEGNIIDISHLHPGMYIVEVVVENIRLRQKLIVE